MLEIGEFSGSVSAVQLLHPFVQNLDKYLVSILAQQSCLLRNAGNKWWWPVHVVICRSSSGGLAQVNGDSFSGLKLSNNRRVDRVWILLIFMYSNFLLFYFICFIFILFGM